MHVFPCMFFFVRYRHILTLACIIIQLNEWGCRDDGMGYVKNRGNFSSIVCERGRERGREGGRERGRGEREPGRGREIYQEKRGGCTMQNQNQSGGEGGREINKEGGRKGGRQGKGEGKAEKE